MTHQLQFCNEDDQFSTTFRKRSQCWQRTLWSDYMVKQPEVEQTLFRWWGNRTLSVRLFEAAETNEHHAR